MTSDGEGEPDARALRVLHVTAVEVSNYHLNSLAEQLQGRVQLSALTLGHAATFVTELEKRGAQAMALGARWRLGLPFALARVLAICRRVRPDILHGHLYDPSLIAAMAARAFHVPLVTTRHHSDALYRLPCVRRAIYLQGERFVNASATHILAPSTRVQEVLTRREGVPPARVSVVPYPQERFRFVGRRPAAEVRRAIDAPEGPLVVTVARLHPEKGIAVLLQALAQVPEVALAVILGRGPELGRLSSQASVLGLAGRVRFLGWRDDALDVVAAADVAVHPSLHEALPSAVIEALALGRPIVATDVSGVRDILGDPPAGRVVPPGDAPALARAIRETLEGLGAARQKAEGGRERLLEWMDPERVAEAHLRCYRAVVRREQPPRL